MTVGRFTGGWFIDRYSRVAVVRASALMGGVGYWADYFLSIAPGLLGCLLYFGDWVPRWASR